MKDLCCMVKLHLSNYTYEICNIACINGHLTSLKYGMFKICS